MDARMLGTAGGTGVSRYAAGLAEALGRIGGRPPELLSDGGGLSPRAGRWLRALWPGARTARQVPPSRLVAPDLFRLAQVHFDLHGTLLAVRAPGPPGIMHWTYPVPLRMAGWTNLYTVHDAIPLSRPDLTRIDPRRHRRLLDRVSEAAAALVTVTDAARWEIIAALGCPADFVVDCGQAVAPSPALPNALPESLAPGGYLLMLGAIERRKNIVATLAAYRASGVTLPLLIVGPDGDATAEVEAALAITPGAHRLPYQSDAAVSALLGHARALLMPSLAEGFGLPVVEAMALGTPVVTSRGGALGEVAGEAALLVDPTAPPELADAIRRLATDDDLAHALSTAGRVNAARFTPDRFAERLAALHARLIAPPV